MLDTVLRIAFLNTSGNLGGAEICLLDMLAVLRNQHPHWALCLITGEDGPLLEQANTLGVHVMALPFPDEIASLGDSAVAPDWRLLHRLLMSVPAVRSYALSLRAQLRRLQPNIAHSNGLKMHVVSALAKLPNTKLIWHMHDYLGARPFMRHVLRAMRDIPDGIIAVSDSVAKDVRRCTRHANVSTLLNAADLDEFSPYGEAPNLDVLCGLHPAPSATLRVGLVATMAWWKGHRVFIEAISKIGRQISLRAYVIGGSLYSTGSRQESVDELKLYAHQLGIGDRVGFTGFVSRPADVIRALDVVVHASTKPEPFGRVLAEAIACGKPFISSGMGGAAEIIASGDFSRTFDGSASDLARVITALASNPTERVRLGENGLAAAREYFSRDRLAWQLNSIYQRCECRN